MNCIDALQSAAGFSVCSGSETPQQAKAFVSKSGNLFDPQDSQDVRKIDLHMRTMAPKYPYKYININKKEQKRSKNINITFGFL